MNKPIKPDIQIPESFAENGIKADFNNEKLQNGFDNLQPDVLAGDNLNKFIDDTYKGLNYAMKASDAINLIKEGETLTLEDGKLVSGASGGGLELGDIGIAPLGIDESKGKRRYLNGQLIMQSQYVGFTNKLKSAIALYPSLATTESNWQATVTISALGQCGKFVVDDEQGTIRLPKIIMPIQGLTNLSNLAEIVEAGLPTHTHTRGSMNITGSLTLAINEYSTSGAFTASNAGGKQSANGDDSASTKFKFDASNSWTGETSTGNYSSDLAITNTVQQEQIQYPYFIQVATGAETEDNIINEIELNNPFSLLDYKYSEYELNNASWLQSQGQFNAKAIYPDVYDLLLKIYNGTETKAGVSVKLSTDGFTDYDFVLNTLDETFRLPLKVKLASGKAVVGNGKTLGLFNGTDTCNLAGGLTTGSSLRAILGTSNYIEELGVSAELGEPGSDITMGVTTDPTKSGIETSDNGLYLYFYVGETVQNANLINAGRALEILPNKLDKEQLYNKMTNCILEEPQRIKYTLTDGTLTIKAGSVVIVPYGVEDLTTTYPVGSTFLNDNFKVYDTQFADGKFFVWAELQGDCTGRVENTTIADRLFFIRIDSNVVQGYITTDSGIEDYTGTGNCVLYRTDLNKMKHWNEGTATNNVYCFPLGVVIGDGTNLFGSIKQVFNGFGYIGSTVWVDKGVKGLASNGRNADGTLNNIEAHTENILVYTNNSHSNGQKFYSFKDPVNGVWTGIDYISQVSIDNGDWVYNEEQNIWRWKGQLRKWFPFAEGFLETTSPYKITSFQPKQPVRLVDYNELEEVHCIVETYRNGNSWYNIYSNGWCEQGGNISVVEGSNVITLLVAYANKFYSVIPTRNANADTTSAQTVFTRGKTTTTFDLYCSGSTGYSWQAGGWII